jgi:hypothetical protein
MKVSSRAPPAEQAAMTRCQRVSHARFTAATGWRPRYPSVREGLDLRRRLAH